MERDKKDRTPIPYKAIILGIIGIGFLFFLYFHFSHRPDQVNRSQTPQPKAAIVDHLSISYPNQAFINECSAILKEAGFTVDYYAGKEVTVEFYRKLPAFGYDLIILRVHSTFYPSVAMFTSEPYSTQRYRYEQFLNRVGSGYLGGYRKGAPRYLVVTDKFVRFSMEGLFKDTIIIMMGCSGIKIQMATAFLEKGAKAYIGWDGPVTASHTDRAIVSFLKYLLIKRQTIAKAVGQTMKEVDRESQYMSSLLFWPIKAGNLSIKTENNKVIQEYVSP